MLPLAPRLDHVIVNVLNDLDDAAERYRRLGFQLTPRGHHTLGTSNNLAIFGTDYVELLGYERGREGSRPDLVETPPGLAGLAFKPPADPRFAGELVTAFAADPAREFSRPVDTPDGKQDARFRTIAVPRALSSGRVFFCHHYTPELVWRDEWRQHPNGVVGIAAFTVATPDPARTAEPFTRLFGPLRSIEGGLALATDGAEIRLLTPAALARTFGDALVAFDPGADRMVALDLRTRSLEAARSALAQGGVETLEGNARLVVPARAACGVALVFGQA